MMMMWSEAQLVILFYFEINGTDDNMLEMLSRGGARGAHVVILTFGALEWDARDVAVAFSTDFISERKSTN